MQSVIEVQVVFDPPPNATSTGDSYDSSMDKMTREALARAKLRQDPAAITAMKALGVSFEQAAHEMAGLLGNQDAKITPEMAPNQATLGRDGPVRRLPIQTDSLPNAIISILRTSSGPLRKAQILDRLRTTTPPYYDGSPASYKAVSNTLARLHNKMGKIEYLPGPKPRQIRLTAEANL
jgi:hypothetical protein